MPIPVGSAVGQMLALAKATQGPDADITTLVRTIEAWAGIEVAGGKDAQAVRRIA
jgi:hypothetical protein